MQTEKEKETHRRMDTDEETEAQMSDVNRHRWDKQLNQSVLPNSVASLEGASISPTLPSSPPPQAP